MTEIEEFIEDRCHDIERYAQQFEHDPWEFRYIEIYRQILKWHQNWPILVETPTEFNEVSTEPDRIIFQMQKKFAWATTNEYIRAYGTDPPTAPILKIIANQWSEHPAFNQSWLNK